MMRCPLCRRVLPERDRQVGRCAACGQAVPDWARLGGAAGGFGAASWWVQGRWTAWAASFGLLVPAAMLVMNRVLERQGMAQPALAEQMQPWLGALLLVVILALLGAGVALVAASRIKAWRLAACCALALVANGLLLAAWIAGKLFRTP